MTDAREIFEQQFPCPRSCEFRDGRYWASEPYHWGADKQADDHSRLWTGWKAASESLRAALAAKDAENAKQAAEIERLKTIGKESFDKLNDYQNGYFEQKKQIEQLQADLARTESCFSYAHDRAEQLQARVNGLDIEVGQLEIKNNVSNITVSCRDATLANIERSLKIASSDRDWKAIERIIKGFEPEV